MGNKSFGFFNSIRFNKVPFFVIFSISSAHFIAMFRLIRGSLFNSYPFISPDGFDWITEGLTLHLKLRGFPVGELLYLRNPLVVSILAIDSFLPISGLFFCLAVGLSLFVIHWSLFRICRFFQISKNISLGFACIPLLGIISTMKFWVLSDTIAMAIMMILLEQMIQYQILGQKQYLYRASVLSLIGGLTQTYVLIPFLVGIGLKALKDFQRKHFLSPNIILGASVPLLVGGLQLLWGKFMPYIERPVQFGFLRFSTQMTGFYLNVWAIVFLPFAPLIVKLVSRTGFKKLMKEPEILYLCATTISFATFTYFYQWYESRFTYIYIPIFILTVASIVARSRFYKKLTVGTVFFMLFLDIFVTPGNPWIPKVKDLRIRPNETWWAQVLNATPVDRFQSATYCANKIDACAEAKTPEDTDPYVEKMHRQYQKLVNEAINLGIPLKF